jgi:hypothetical protein
VKLLPEEGILSLPMSFDFGGAKTPYQVGSVFAVVFPKIRIKYLFIE